MLPFAADSVDLVVANHSLEHFEDLDGAVREIGRIVKCGGALFVSVPDASTLTDRIYRWLGRGGGHVNAIVDPIEFADYIQARTGLPWQATRVLYSGLSFLNRKNCARRQRKLWLAGGGFEFTLQAATYGFRLLDRIFGTRLSIYGWAFYFGGLPFAVEEPWTNVCVRCGAGAGSVWLEGSGAVQKFVLVPYYRCSACDAVNLFTRDSS
jgi:SAM-dependent methyltransferase